MRNAVMGALFLGCAVVGALPVRGGPVAATNTAETVELVSRLQSHLKDAQDFLLKTRVDQIDAAHLPPGATVPEAEEYRLQAEILARLYLEHIEEVHGLEEAWRQQADLEQEIGAWKGFEEPPPYSILRADALRDSAQSLEMKLSTADTAEALLTSILADESSNLKESDAHQRLLDEQLEASKDVVRTERLTWQKKLETLRGRRIEATIALDETRRRVLKIGMAHDRQELAFITQKLAVVNRNLRFSQADLDQVLARVDEDRRAVDVELADAGTEFLKRQRDLETSRAELNRTAAGGAEAVRLQAAINLRSEQMETSSQRQTMLRQIAEIHIFERSLWQRRFSAFHTKDLDEIRIGYEQLEKLKRLIDSVRPLFYQRIELADKLIDEQRNRFSGGSDGHSSSESAELLTAFRQRGDFARRALLNLERVERLALRWKEALDEDRRNLPATARVRDLFGGFSSFFNKLWDFELFAVQDTVTVDGQAVTGRRSVTIGKITLAILILVLGYWFSSLIARVLEKWIIHRTHMEMARAELIRRWTRIAFIAALVVFSLLMVKIPLTVFAFAGGALAIGVGFGMQNLIKNFISGIIILFERPFRIGDVLDIDGHRGTVSAIGIRSSVVRLWDGTETLIPNSALLENNLTNWTYSNRSVRFSVSVGVAYGSDSRLVAELLEKIVNDHKLVQKVPTPQVLFTEFGDNNLNFEVRFWVDVARCNAAQIASDLRHTMAQEFAAHGISMAYPQRDIHLDASRPLSVQVVKNGTELPESKP